MFNTITKKDSILKDLKQFNVIELEEIQKELNLLIETKKSIELKKQNDIIEFKNKYDNENYVCIYQPSNSNNWFIEENPNFNDLNNFGIGVCCYATFILKSKLNEYIN